MLPQQQALFNDQQIRVLIKKQEKMRLLNSKEVLPQLMQIKKQSLFKTISDKRLSKSLRIKKQRRKILTSAMIQWQNKFKQANTNTLSQQASNPFNLNVSYWNTNEIPIFVKLLKIINQKSKRKIPQYTGKCHQYVRILMQSLFTRAIRKIQSIIFSTRPQEDCFHLSAPQMFKLMKLMVTFSKKHDQQIYLLFKKLGNYINDVYDNTPILQQQLLAIRNMIVQIVKNEFEPSIQNCEGKVRGTSLVLWDNQQVQQLKKLFLQTNNDVNKISKLLSQQFVKQFDKNFFDRRKIITKLNYIFVTGVQYVKNMGIDLDILERIEKLNITSKQSKWIFMNRYNQDEILIISKVLHLKPSSKFSQQQICKFVEFMEELTKKNFLKKQQRYKMHVAEYKRMLEPRKVVKDYPIRIVFTQQQEIAACNFYVRLGPQWSQIHNRMILQFPERKQQLTYKRVHSKIITAIHNGINKLRYIIFKQTARDPKNLRITWQWVFCNATKQANTPYLQRMIHIYLYNRIDFHCQKKDIELRRYLSIWQK